MYITKLWYSWIIFTAYLVIFKSCYQALMLIKCIGTSLTCYAFYPLHMYCLNLLFIQWCNCRKKTRNNFKISLTQYMPYVSSDVSEMGLAVDIITGRVHFWRECIFNIISKRRFARSQSGLFRTSRSRVTWSANGSECRGETLQEVLQDTVPLLSV